MKISIEKDKIKPLKKIKKTEGLINSSLYLLRPTGPKKVAVDLQLNHKKRIKVEK